jgi:hypothetical protein
MFPLRTLLLLTGLLGCTTLTAAAQADDGFLRRNGATYTVRHLTRQAHLPNGRTVTPEGFVLGPDGRRTPLEEGRGCDLRGNPVGASQQPNGAWLLAAAPTVAPPQPAALRHLPPGQQKKWWKKYFGKKRGHKHG